MKYEQNSNWRESDHPRDSEGKFTDSTGTKIRKWTADAEPKRKQIKLSACEYAIADKARKEKYAEYRRNGMPKQDYVFTDGKFVVFINRSRDNFIISQVLDIEKDRDLINAYIGEIQ